MRLYTFVIAIMLLSPSVGRAAPGFDRQLEMLLAEYLVIQSALAQDHDRGVKRAARRIQRLAQRAGKQLPSSDPRLVRRRWMIQTITSSVQRLSAARTIAERRSALLALSRPLAVWAVRTKPKGVNIAISRTARGVWLQRGIPLRNPYFGLSRLPTGKVVAGPHKHHAVGRMDTCPTKYELSYFKRLERSIPGVTVPKSAVPKSAK